MKLTILKLTIIIIIFLRYTSYSINYSIKNKIEIARNIYILCLNPRNLPTWSVAELEIYFWGAIYNLFFMCIKSKIVTYNQRSQFHTERCFNLAKGTICFDISQYRCTVSELPLYSIYIYIYIYIFNYKIIINN